jgi:hypothetical protein
MPWVGIEPKVPVLGRAKTFRASEYVANIIALITYSSETQLTKSLTVLTELQQRSNKARLSD